VKPARNSPADLDLGKRAQPEATLDEDGIKIVTSCFTGPRVSASDRTPIGVLTVSIPRSYEGEFQVRFRDPVVAGASPVAVFGGEAEENIVLRDSGVFKVACPMFVRGDANDDGSVDLTDAVVILELLFSGGRSIRCMHAADVDDSGAVQITDPIYLLMYLFRGGEEPVAPFREAGTDEEVDELPCAGFYPQQG
jgi:hypothetical protein